MGFPIKTESDLSMGSYDPSAAENSIEDPKIKILFIKQSVYSEITLLKESINHRFDSADKRTSDFKEDVGHRFDAINAYLPKLATEESVAHRFESVDKRFDAVDKQFDEIKTTGKWVIGVLVVILSGMTAGGLGMYKDLSGSIAQTNRDLSAGIAQTNASIAQTNKDLSASIAQTNKDLSASINAIHSTLIQMQNSQSSHH